MSEAPVLILSGLAGGAVALSALGALPYALRAEVPARWGGWGGALASGLMLGACYVLISEALVGNGVGAIGGAGLGVAYTLWTHRLAGTERLDTRPDQPSDASLSSRLLLRNALHSAAEGVAIGVGAVVSLQLGAFLAITLAVHNAAESMALTEFLARDAGASVRRSAALCVIARAPQWVLAVAALLLVPLAGVALPWCLGFAAGSLLFLVLTELLPDSYARAGDRAVAFLVTLLAGVVVLMSSFYAG